MKTIVRRPILHYIIMTVYIAAPVVNILLVWLFSAASLGTILSRLFTGYGYLATIWLVTAPLVGLSLFLVSKWTWYVFIGHSLLVLVDFVYKWISRPGYYSSTVDGVLNILILLGNVVLVGIVLYVVQRDFRSPYFQVLQRSFREERRIPIRYFVRLNGTDCRITDLSPGGCFVAEPQLPDSSTGDFDMTLKVADLTISGKARLMRQVPSGFGFMFIAISRRQRLQISRFLKQRFALRYLVSIPGSWISNGQTIEGVIHDLSSGGCYVTAEQPLVEEGQRGQVEMRTAEHVETATASVAWNNGVGGFHKPPGFGLAFDRRHKRFVRHLVKEHGKMQLVR